MAKIISSVNLDSLDALTNDLKQDLFLNENFITVALDNTTPDIKDELSIALSILFDNCFVTRHYIAALRDLVDCIYKGVDFEYSKDNILFSAISNTDITKFD